ncbi:hypothetical protein [Segniliparus rugosus]|uniref:Uncharacterized protein n=1 Tax=Segniliparus rugosus (strain ATCC BAA-974 / DSM 45345 / CCUG 50838 / CIP 108380 / JCM 13579 / CDC 945) TaxID=679197 RepID=E5XPJ6_SEGRC|nr:hypothetical protein [Segniliparus rugosus]EFV13735.2 hypothetical protein HMPREF9336_01418 [Segniliparus rugosus ATCC BAA-974]
MAGGLNADNARADPLPDCPPAAAENPPIRHFDCTMRSNDQLGLRFDVRYAPASTAGRDQPANVTIEVFDRAGAHAQTIVEPLEKDAGGWPTLVDVDEDGRDEILVPIQGVPHGSRFRWALWRATGEAAVFRRQPEMDGILLWHDPDGYVVLESIVSYVHVAIAFYKVEEPDFKPVLALLVNTKEQVGDGRCELLGEPDLTELGMTSEQAEQVFCAKT